MGYYNKYNDYELLYLVKDGNEKALNYLFLKYDNVIFTQIKISFNASYNKTEDLMQEGRMILFNCIKSYKQENSITFYSYFLLCLKRHFARLKNNDYFSINSPCLLCENDIDDTIYDYNEEIIIDDKKLNINSCVDLLKNTKYYNLFVECVINNINLTYYSKLHNLKYHQCYRDYNDMIELIKKRLT